MTLPEHQAQVRTIETALRAVGARNVSVGETAAQGNPWGWRTEITYTVDRADYFDVVSIRVTSDRDVATS